MSCFVPFWTYCTPFCLTCHCLSKAALLLCSTPDIWYEGYGHESDLSLRYWYVYSWPIGSQTWSICTRVPGQKLKVLFTPSAICLALACKLQSA